MKILLINKFLYPKGGDAVSTLSTGSLLQAKGHIVDYWGMAHPLNSNFDLKNYFVAYKDYNKRNNVFKKFDYSLNILYSLESKSLIKKVISISKPDIIHLNNFAHQISPSILDVFQRFNIPVVMTMRDYKLVCPSYSLLLKGEICEKCTHSKFFNCFLNRCVKNSYPKSFLSSVEMYLHHKVLHIYKHVDIFIATSEFLKSKINEMGFNSSVQILPNFVNLNDYIPNYQWKEDSIVYFGRLSPEKGLGTLIDTMKYFKNIKLKIIGDGPLKTILQNKIKRDGVKNVVFLGHFDLISLKDEIKKCMFNILPSECYETFGRSIIESAALGKLTIGSGIGGIPETIKHNETGLIFEPGNSEDLRLKIEYLVNNPTMIIEMGKRARSFVEAEFNAEKHYLKLMEIYKQAISFHQ